MFQILIVEDQPAEIRLLREAFREAKAPHQLHIVQDGDDALRFLHHEGGYSSAPRPDLILLDLNLPKKDGIEVLKDLKYDPQLQTVPVIVLTSSGSDTDITNAYYHHANAYVQKPDNMDEYFELVRELELFWLGVVTMPPASSKPKSGW